MYIWNSYGNIVHMKMEINMSPLMHPVGPEMGGYTPLRGALENRSFQHVDTSMMTRNKTVVAMINNQTKKNAKDRTQEQRKKKNNEQEQEETTCKHRSRRRRKPKQKKEDKKKKQEEQMEYN